MLRATAKWLFQFNLYRSMVFWSCYLIYDIWFLFFPIK
jgi:hypothetical protein